MARERPCKVGTIPSLVILRYRYNIEPGKRIVFRMAAHGTRWETSIVDRVNENGYFFVRRH